MLRVPWARRGLAIRGRRRLVIINMNAKWMIHLANFLAAADATAVSGTVLNDSDIKCGQAPVEF